MSRLQTIADKLYTYARNHDMTSTRVDNATWPQVKNQLGNDFPDKFSHAELQKVKRLVVESLRDLERRAVRDKIKAQIKTWLDNNYPDYEFDYGYIKDKLRIELWPYGKPIVAESE